MTDRPIYLGNVYNPDNHSGYAGAVWDRYGIAASLTTMQGGGREPMVIVKVEHERDSLLGVDS